MEIAVIGDGNFITGFQLAGVRKAFPTEEADVGKLFEQVMAMPDIGIVITNGSVFGKLSQRLKDLAMTQVKPTVVVLSHDVEAEDNLRMMIKRSLGIDLWSKEANKKE